MHEELLDTAIAAARAGAAVLQRYFRGDGLEVRRKGQNDFVTRADHESEEAVVSEILRRHPDHRILAEEGGASRGGNGACEWLIDPLDGTTNFLQGLPVYCVSIACRRGDELLAGVVQDPQGDNLFAAAAGSGAFWNGRRMQTSQVPLPGAFLATGYPFRAHAALDAYLAVFREVFFQAKAIRRCGAAALDLAYTAAGVYDGFFEFRLSPWDIGAGILLMQEAGGRVTDLDGGTGYFGSGNIVAGGPALHSDLLACVQRHASEALLDRLESRQNPSSPAAPVPA